MGWNDHLEHLNQKGWTDRLPDPSTPPHTTHHNAGQRRINMDLSYAQGWKPEPGDVLVGEVTDISVGQSLYGGAYPIITVQPEDGGELVAIHGFHTGLKARFLELKPKVGERLGVKYDGKRPLKSDNTKDVAVYIVKVDGRGAENVWAQMDAPTAEEVPDTDAPVTNDDFRHAKRDDGDDIPF